MGSSTVQAASAQSAPGASLHFDRTEFERRHRHVREAMVEHDLDGLLLSRIEDQYWLTGLDTDGFCIFHAVFISLDGAITHISRTADLANVRYSSICQDVDLWIDGEGHSKGAVVKETLARHRMAGKRLGIQLDTYGLLPQLYLELQERCEGFCELVDASDLVRNLRLIKSDQEARLPQNRGHDRRQDARCRAGRDPCGCLRRRDHGQGLVHVVCQ